MAFNTGPAVGYSFLNITLAAPTTTVVKTGAGILHTITFTKPVATAVVTIYDNTAASGTILWTTGAMGALTTPFSIDLQRIPFFTGLTVVIAAANADAVVIYE